MCGLRQFWILVWSSCTLYAVLVHIVFGCWTAGKDQEKALSKSEVYNEIDTKHISLGQRQFGEVPTCIECVCLFAKFGGTRTKSYWVVLRRVLSERHSSDSVFPWHHFTLLAEWVFVWLDYHCHYLMFRVSTFQCTPLQKKSSHMHYIMMHDFYGYIYIYILFHFDVFILVAIGLKFHPHAMSICLWSKAGLHFLPLYLWLIRIVSALRRDG